MRSQFKLILGVFAILLFQCKNSDDSNNNGGTGGNVIATATYRITFTPNFTPNSHPTDYPAGAMFSKMIIVAHGNSGVLFQPGTLASPGLKQYAEDGDTSGLELELGSSGDGETITIVTGVGIPADGSEFREITITPNNTRISFAARIAPSPDWFVGVNTFNLALPDNTLVETFELTLEAYDAGTDAGTTYAAANNPNTEPVSIVSGDPFVDPNTGQIARFGTLLFERTDIGDE